MCQAAEILFASALNALERVKEADHRMGSISCPNFTKFVFGLSNLYTRKFLPVIEVNCSVFKCLVSGTNLEVVDLIVLGINKV